MVATATSVLNRLIAHAKTPKFRHKNPKIAPKSPPFSPSKSAAAAIAATLSSGDLSKSISVLSATQFPFPPSLYVQLLQLCASKQAILNARTVENHVIKFCKTPSTFVFNRLIEVYAKCESLVDARKVFDEMTVRDGGSWNAVISAYSRAELSEEAILLFARMNGEGISPKDVTFASVLGCCADLMEVFLGRQVHCLVVKYGYCSNLIVGTAMVNVYGKCRVMRDARAVFDSISEPNDVSWNVIVRRYLEVGELKEVLVMFARMIGEGMVPLSFTVSNALIACSNGLALEEGCQIHGILVKMGFGSDNVVKSSLMEMYAKNGFPDDVRRVFDEDDVKDVFVWTSMVSCLATCGRTAEAEMLFNEMPERSVVSWNAMLAGYVSSCLWESAFDLFSRMRLETGDSDLVTLGLMLNACAGLSDLDRGKQIHGFVCRHGLILNLFFSNALLDMYAKCGCLGYAENWFFKVAPGRDTISWNSMISGYENQFRSEEALVAFSKMQSETSPNEFSFSTALAACANIFMLEHGKQIHGYMLRNGFEIDVITRGALLDMYSKCRLLEYALKIFDEAKSRDLILWNSMILGCAYNGRGEYGLELFEDMRKDGIMADNVTFNGLLLACISEGYVDLGRRYFNLMVEEYDIIPRLEHYECMIELLGKNSYMVELEDFVQKMPFAPTIPMWTRIFDCCREHGNKRLGELAADKINESNPLIPVRFEILDTRESCMP